MAKVTINKFSDGIAKDSREPVSAKCAYVQNFDVLSYPYQLNPFRGMTANEDTTYGLTDFLYGVFGSGISTNVLAYGRQVANDRPEVYMKTGDIITGSWTTALTATGAATQTRSSGSNLWHLYKNYAYFACGGRYIGRVGDLSNGTAATLVDNYYDLTSFTTVTQAITHPKDDIMYVGVDNKIYKNNAGTFALALTLPSYLTVTSVTYWGNYLAIACRVTNIVGNSIVYLWDRDTSLNTLTESIDWGNGELNILENIDGELVGISIIGRTSFNLTSKITVKFWSGTFRGETKELISETSGAVLYIKKYRAGNNLYFGADIQLNGTARDCIFVVGKREDGGFTLAGDVNVNNDTAISNIDGFVKFDDIWFIAYDDGSVNRTLTGGTYTGTSVWESLVNPRMDLDDRHSMKQLRAVSLSYEQLPAAGVATLYYRVDGGAWTEILSDTVEGSVFMEATQTNAGAPFIEGREFEFKIESEGGAVITELAYNYDVTESNING